MATSACGRTDDRTLYRALRDLVRVVHGVPVLALLGKEALDHGVAGVHRRDAGKERLELGAVHHRPTERWQLAEHLQELAVRDRPATRETSVGTHPTLNSN